MPQHASQFYLDNARICPSVYTLRPDYRALLMTIDNIPQGPSDSLGDAMLQDAEGVAKATLKTTAISDVPHIKSWREAYKAFGAKPSKFRSSVEALTRRAESGLPRVNRLTDIYNPISVKHCIPLGGEDLDKYEGAPVLIRATGKEEFVANAGGEVVIEHVDPGEVVWCDDKGVTCRRWNWRQGPRTALSEETTRVLFILDALDPITDEAIYSAANELADALRSLSPKVEVSTKLLKAGSD